MACAGECCAVSEKGITDRHGKKTEIHGNMSARVFQCPKGDSIPVKTDET
jgi:hypothetical protein